MKSILVVFGQDLPKKNKKRYYQFDEVLGPKELEKFVKPGSVQEAYRLTNELAKKEFSKSADYRGYKLWWMHYDTIYANFCLPYTQYADLLFYLKNFEEVHLFQPPWPKLFRYFLEAHGRSCLIYKKRRFLPPFGILIQLFLSIVFLPLLTIARPGLMVWIGDKFADSSHDYDFRMKFIYEELRKRKIPFAEFIRSLEPWPVVLNHAWKRRRPVLYSYAIFEFIHYLAGPFVKKYNFSGVDSEQHFWFLVGTHYLRNIKGSIWSILAMKFILRLIGIKSAIIVSACERTTHEVLGCKLAGIKTVGIQHAAIPKYYFVSDFMTGFDEEKKISVDQYGLWSDWWRDYYLKNSNAYKPEQLYVSGPIRPLAKETEVPASSGGSLKVLYISEGLAAPKEILPFISAILESEGFKLYFKFRPYKDSFEFWLKENRPDIYNKILETANILRGTMQEAVSLCDVVVGSHSTAVLESLLYLRPFIFFWTNKWGDYFDLRPLGRENHFFADNPEELIEYIKQSRNIPKDILEKLQERFFGNPYQNGSRWVVEQAKPKNPVLD